MESLPQDVLLRIFNLLETEERARLAVVCKEWHDIVSSTWTNVTFHPANAAECSRQTTWLEGLGLHVTSLRSLQIIPANSYPYEDALAGLFCFALLSEELACIHGKHGV